MVYVVRDGGDGVEMVVMVLNRSPSWYEESRRKGIQITILDPGGWSRALAAVNGSQEKRGWAKHIFVNNNRKFRAMIAVFIYRAYNYCILYPEQSRVRSPSQYNDSEHLTAHVPDARVSRLRAPRGNAIIHSPPS